MFALASESAAGTLEGAAWNHCISSLKYMTKALIIWVFPLPAIPEIFYDDNLPFLSSSMILLTISF